MLAFLDVLLRGVSLAAHSLIVGGALFVIAVLRPWSVASADSAANTATAVVVRRSRRLIIAAAAAVALTQAASLVIAVGALRDGVAWPVAAAASTLYVRVGLLRLALAVTIAGLAVAMRDRERDPRSWWTLLIAAGGVIVAAAGTSHAAARLEHRAALVALDAGHQLAAAVWIGGLLFLLVTAVGVDRAWSGERLARFSGLALVAVAALALAGTALTVVYVGGIGGLIGTAYGLMVLTKIALLGALLGLGGANFRAVRALARDEPVSLARLMRYVEVEVGLGLTVFLAAASLTSLPPGGDVIADRATLGDVVTRFTPQWPSLASPRHEELAGLGDREAPRTDEDRAWSEYNHHVAGLFVLAMGLLGIAESTTLRRWTRHWPLLFIPLAIFVLVRADPEAWPLGPVGFVASMADPEVLQHRFFALMVALFGIFEWLVRTGRFSSPAPAFVFPMLCAVGGGILLTHSHATLSVKSEFLMEVTHTPLALLGMLVGWGRWLELRLPSSRPRLAARLSPIALALVGVLLLLYREG